MQWEAVEAIGTVASAVLVLIAGAVAIWQLREGRKVAQFDATQRLIDRMLDPQFVDAIRYVIDELPKRMEDPAYRKELETSRGWDVDPKRHPELVVLVRLEETGIYVRHRLIDGHALLEFNAVLILQSWESLKEVVALMRTSHRNPRVWSNAEYLYDRAKALRSSAVHAR